MMRTKNEPSSVETGRKTRSTKIEIDAFDEDVIRQTIHDMILRKVALPTLKNLLETLSENWLYRQEGNSSGHFEELGVYLEKMR